MGWGLAAAGVGAAGAIGSSLIKQGGSTTSTGTSAPWTGEQPDLYEALNAALAQYQKDPRGPSYYPSDTYAPLNYNETSSLGSLINTGTNGTPALDAAQGGVASIASGSQEGLTQPAMEQSQGTLEQIMGNSMNPSSNPYLQQAENNTVAATLPAIQAQAAAGGRADSGAANFAQAQGLASALGNLNYGQYNTGVSQAETAANQAGTNYGQSINAVNQAGLVAPGLNSATMGNLEESYNAGDTMQQNSQNQLDADISRYNYGQEQPYNAISLLEGETTGSGGTSTSSVPYYSNGLANALSGGTSALGLYNAFGGSSLFGGTNSGGWGTSATPNTWDDSDSFVNEFGS